MAKFLTKKIGDLGEKIARDYLKKRGYQILAKNYVPKWLGFDKKEIDIVAEKENTISFIEVKTLVGSKNFLPEEKVNSLKKRKILKAAESFLLENKISLDKKWQIDIISIKIDLNSKKAKISHLKNVVS